MTFAQFIAFFTGILAQISGIIRVIAAFGLAFVLLVAVASLLGYNVPYLPNLSGSDTGKAAMIAAIAFALRG